MNPDLDNDSVRQINAKRLLWPNFISLDDWKFMSIKSGKMYDFSAADLSQIDRIETEGLFVI